MLNSIGALGFAVPALILVGLSWTLTGVVMSDAPRKKLDPALILLLSGLVGLCINVTILSMQVNRLPALRVWLLAGGCYFISSGLNFLMLQVMSYAMQRGPNGVIWSLIQSALVFPFLTGVLFYGSAFTIIRCAGLVLVLLALALLGAAKENQVKSQGWKKPTFLAFLMTGLILSLNTIPSYYPELQKLPSVARTLCGGTGALLVGGIWNLRKYCANTPEQWLHLIKNRHIWKYILMLQCFGLLASYLLLYPGLDAMAKAGAGCISYPLIVGSCIIGFNLYSMLKLREKCTLLQVGGVLCCVAGLALLI